MGNPPFIGASTMRRALGDGYVDALRRTWPEVPVSADFVMHWWHHAAELTAHSTLSTFGLITTNSISQNFNRRVIQAHMDDTKHPISLAIVIPDHPWVEHADGAALRIAVTVGSSQASLGRLSKVVSKHPFENGEVQVSLADRVGVIHADLRVGANVASARQLQAMAGLSCPGFKLHGAGFTVSSATAADLGLGTLSEIGKCVRAYRNGKDLTDRPRNAMVIDLFGLDINTVLARFPAIYQHLVERVKPERDQNPRSTYRERWWNHGEPRGAFRPALAGLGRYIATVETAKHRTFQFLTADVAPDNKLIAIASANAEVLGVLSSIAHVVWALASGGRLGVGNDLVYVKSKSF